MPPSVNRWLIPVVRKSGGRTYPQMVETQESKDFKKMFTSFLKREVDKQEWNIDDTKEGQWTVTFTYILSNAGADTHNYYKVPIDCLTGVVINDDKNVKAGTDRYFYGNKSVKGFKLSLRKDSFIGLFNDSQSEQSQLNRCIKCRFYQNGKCSVLKKIRGNYLTEDFDFKNQTCKKFVEKKGK